MPARNRLVRVTVEIPEARISTSKYYREADLAQLRDITGALGIDTADAVKRLQEITANDPET